MARMSKMDYQMHLRMEQMKCIGESRNQAKQEYKEMLHIGEHANNRTVGIHITRPIPPINRPVWHL